MVMRILIVHSGNAVAGNSEKYTFVREQGEALRALGVNVQYFAIVGKGVIGYLSNYSRLMKAIADFQPDVIHAHYGLSGLLANLQRQVPVVTTYHGSDINLPKILRFSKIAIRLSAHNIFVSQRNLALALGESQAKCKAYNVKRIGQKDGSAELPASTPYTLHPTPNYTLLPCGVNLTDDQLLSRSEARKTLGLAEEETIILFAGAFDNAVKDAPLALASVALFNDVGSLNENGEASFVAPTLYTLHPTPILQELRGFSRTEVNCWMCAANALLMTSKTEGSPQVVKEAMACGCPIVSVDVGDVAERVEGVEGCYVVSSREPADIAAALQKVITFKGKTNGREHIIEKGISNRQVAEQLINIYTSIYHD